MIKLGCVCIIDNQGVAMYSRKFVITIIICAIAFGAVIFMFSPFFYLREIVISGENTVTRAEITNRLEADLTTNLLFFNTRAARRRIMQNLYIADVTFTRDLPG